MAEEKSKNDLASLADLAPEEIPRGHARKDTHRWCKGKPGREHVPVIVIPANLPNWWQEKGCGWGTITAYGDELRYRCEHVEQCNTCGKVLRRNYSWLPQTRLLPNEMAASECPEYTPMAEVP